jgi:hypothetical protein
VGGSSSYRPVPPSVGGSSYYRPVPPSVDYSRPVPPPTYVNRYYYDNTYYYTPTYYDTPIYRNYSGWGGSFWSGYLTGYADGAFDQALWDNAYHSWNSIGIGSYYDVPYTVWNPYYTRILDLSPLYIDYDVPTSWEHPALNPNQDPLEQLAYYHQLQKPGFLGIHSEISAEEARQRLLQGQEVDVAGVAVTSFAQLAQIVPEMARGTAVQGGTLPPEAQQAVQTAMQQQNPPSASQLSADDLVNRLPAFNQVYSPRQLQAEDVVNGKNINRTMDAAQAVYQRPGVQQAIAQWWKDNPNADRDALNREINAIVTQALVDDLTQNGSAYAQQPAYGTNPVTYLKDPSNDPSAVAYNQAAIQKVLSNAQTELSANLITRTSATLQQ